MWLPQVSALRFSAWVDAYAGVGDEAPVDCLAVRTENREHYLDAKPGDKWYIRLGDLPVRSRRYR